MEARFGPRPDAAVRRRDLGGLIALDEPGDVGDRASPLDARLLLAWFTEHGRDLPWRRTRDPWAILVSELMLQQTQVARVIERLPRFLARFPSPADAAAGPAGDVIDEWSGLGYNRRAVHLHRAARSIVEHHDGTVPSTLSELLALPGLGPYTARAVRVFAHEFDDGVVDTNTGRVLARIAGSRLGRGAVQSLADSLVPPGAGWAWNQALMELGALVCRPAPVCGSCPIAGSCAWFVAGRPDPDPANGSAGVSVAQARFEGSDRQGRGRLVDALRTGPVRIAETASIMGWPDDLARAARVARTLVDDGLAVCDGESLRLP